MGLKLTVGTKDQVVMSNGCVITIGRFKDGEVTLEFQAPADLKIHTIFNDPAKQFKRLQKGANKSAKSGQALSPEDQRKDWR